MTTAATETIPRPLVAVGVVVADPASRTLAVRLADRENGYSHLLFREAFQALKRGEESGNLQGLPVYAHGAGARNIAFAVPGDFGMLLFRLGDKVYAELVGKPGLTASIVLDKSTSRFISVSFKHKA